MIVNAQKLPLLGIVIFLGFVAFNFGPNMEAKAGIMGGESIIVMNQEQESADEKDEREFRESLENDC